MLVIVMLLLVFISVSTYRNLNRERNAAMQTVRRQALTLINALAAGARAGTVSYTHLTLPTRSCQCRSRWSPYH